MRTGALAVLAAVLVAGCGGGGGSKGDTQTDPPPPTQPTAATQAAPPADPNTVVRWPRYWATREGAETNADDNLDTEYFAGFDRQSVVYNGQDIVRVLDPKTGKQRGRTNLPSGRFVCAVSPRRQVDAGVAVVGVGSLRSSGGTCDSVRGISMQTGKLLWTFGKQGRDIEEAQIDQRDGKVLFVDSVSIAVLDAKTGKALWRRTARQITGAAKAESEYCKVRAGLAADAPVIVVYPDSCGFSLDGTEIHGLDLNTGKEVWKQLDPRDAERFHPYRVFPHPLDGRVLSALRDGDERDGPGVLAVLDSKTGQGRPIEPPVVRKWDGDPSPPELCTDFGTAEQGEWGSGTCAFVAGRHLVYVTSVMSRKRDGLGLVGTDLATGKRQWTFEKIRRRGKQGYLETVELLGLNADRTEIWLSDGKAEVLRVSVETGEVVGRGRLAPPLKLPRFAAAGPDFLLVRGVSGIEDVTSGLDFYRTAAPPTAADGQPGVD